MPSTWTRSAATWPRWYPAPWNPRTCRCGSAIATETRPRLMARAAGRPPPAPSAGPLGGDGLLGVAAGDLDVAGLGRLVHRDGQGEHAGRVVGGDVVGVQSLAEEDLPGEGAVGPFRHDHLGAVGPHRGALGADGEHVLLDRQVDGAGVDAGQVQADVEVV